MRVDSEESKRQTVEEPTSNNDAEDSGNKKHCRPRS